MRRALSWRRTSWTMVLAVALPAAGIVFTSCTIAPRPQQIRTVFVIPLENRNWTQPASDTEAPPQILGNPNAPFINSLVNGSSPISRQVAYASAYHNALATPSGHNPHIHPSLASYLWSEAGTNFGVFNDNQPFGKDGVHQGTKDHLVSYLNRAGVSWKSYQEDIDTDSAGNVLPRNQWTVPLTNRSGVYSTGVLYNYATKHNPQIYFDDVNGGVGSGAGNPTDAIAIAHFQPIQQLQTDLANNTVARYNWITPNQYNEMHSPLPGGYQGLTGNACAVKKGDDYLSVLIPQIMASEAYRNGGVIIIWTDETEGANADDYSHTLPEIIISPLVRPNVKGKPYTNAINYTHSSDLRTMQEIFQVGPYLGDAANATDLSDLFVCGAIPAGLGPQRR